MARMKVKNKKKVATRRRQTVFQVGSESFKKALARGRALRVAEDNWFERWRQEIKNVRAKNQKIAELQLSLAGLREVNTEVREEYGKTCKAHDEVVESLDRALIKVEQREKVIVGLLLPWAAVLGPASLYDVIHWLNVVDQGVDPETSKEILLLMNEKLKGILLDDNPGGPRGAALLEEIAAYFSKRVREAFSDYFEP